MVSCIRMRKINESEYLVSFCLINDEITNTLESHITTLEGVPNWVKDLNHKYIQILSGEYQLNGNWRQSRVW